MKIPPLQLEHDGKITITICVGSSCYLKGSYEIIQSLKEVINSNSLGQKVTLKGIFCMEKCTEGVNVKINEELFSVSSVTEMREVFRERVLSKLKN